MKHIINMDEWPRAGYYYSFLRAEMPYTNICANVDITNFMAFIRTENYKFYSALLFYIIKTANLIKEFRCRIEDDQPIIWDTIDAGYSIMNDSEIFGTTRTSFVDNFDEFYALSMQEIENYKNGIENKSLHNLQSDVLYITSVPWVQISSFSQSIHRYKDAMPCVGIGRRFGFGTRVQISVSVQAHHSFVDGYHIAMFYKLLETMLADPETYRDNRGDYERLLRKSRPFILSEKETPMFQAF